MALEAVAVNVPLALEQAIAAEAVLDDLAAVVPGLAPRARVYLAPVLHDLGHLEAVPQELEVLALRVLEDLDEAANLVAIEADKCSGHDSCADALH